MSVTQSIRFRLTVWYALALAAGLSIFALAIWTSMWHALRGDVHRNLETHLVNMEGFLREELHDPNVRLPEELLEYSHALPDGTYLAVRSPDGREIFTTTPGFPWPERLNERLEIVKWKHGRFRIVSREIDVNGAKWRVNFAGSLAMVNRTLTRLRWLLLALIPAVVLLATLGGAWVSRRALRPVDEVTAAARTIGIRDLSARLSVPKTGDELQRLSETWNGMLARLEDAVSRLSRFTADASHELRTPLAVIRSTAEIAVRRSRSEEAYRKALSAIVQESERMTALIDDLLFLARCDADSLDLPMEPVALSAMLDDIYASMHPVAEAKGVNMKLDVPPHAGLTVWGNRSAIRRLMLILVDNAVKYTDAGGTVRMVARLEADEVRLSVEDEGEGISETELPLVFQRFYRGAKARDEGSHGFGLGLALASGIAQQHHSKVEVSSSAGQGSTFQVTLPLARL